MKSVNIAVSSSQDANHLNDLLVSLKLKFPFLNFIRIWDTEDFEKSIKGKTFHGWINPGSNDSFAFASSGFKIEQWWPLPFKLAVDFLYHNVLSYTHDNDIPLFGICGGAQQLLLYYGGTIKSVSGYQNHTHEITYLEEPNFSTFQTLNFSLQKEALFNCSFPTQKIIVRTFNSYAGDSSKIGHLILGATSDDKSVAMAYYHPEGLMSGTQYHLEKFYGVCELQTNIIDNFIIQSCMRRQFEDGEFCSPKEIYKKVINRIEVCKQAPTCDIELNLEEDQITYQNYFEFNCSEY